MSDRTPQPIILDTDIGDDIDDAYALALVLASPELDLRGVTTVFCNSVARARQARTVLAVAGRPDVPVAAGCGAVMSTRTDYAPATAAVGTRQVPWAAAKLLNDSRPSQDRSCLPETDLPPLDKRHGVDFLIETIMHGKGDIIPVAIGPFTNIAMAIVKEPRLITKIPRLVVMGACFDRHQSEWNIRCDPVAAAVVFNSGIPMTVVGLDVTMKCRFSTEQVNRLYECPRPLAKNLAAATQAWAAEDSGGWKQGRPVLHDPLAIEVIFRSDLVGTHNGTVTVELAGTRTYGYTLFSPAPANTPAPHDIGVTVNADAALDLWLDRVLAC
ncbi:MAG: hypothetical protein A3K19_22590 [Lentisphaerae bacterium RIFOXYB12_FULL_65_16]|nr:MAG: hypothetical protein A3K18_12400 [Lentisphaerae bacterium RIFOXYA12_64_32]OGV87486.1 MAG: hypothetical protein A3K19_22590 [Lentisphaerae bacterium RIFOXYB12_FULL_65_16]